MTNQSFYDGRMSASEAAHYLNLSVKTLAMMRSNGKGPKFIKPGRVYYYMEDLEQWINRDGRHSSTAQARIKRQNTTGTQSDVC